MSRSLALLFLFGLSSCSYRGGVESDLKWPLKAEVISNVEPQPDLLGPSTDDQLAG